MAYKTEKIDPEYGKKITKKKKEIEKDYLKKAKAKREETQKAKKQAETELRIYEIVPLLLTYHKPGIVLKKIRENFKWELQDRQIRVLIKQAQDHILETGNYSREDEISYAIARYKDLYTRSIEAKDYKTAKDIVEKMCVMMGLNKPVEIDLGIQKLEELLDGLGKIK